MPDPRLDQLAAIAKPQKLIPTTVEFVDIAGLVAGASQGEGLGNQFLGHIRETDAIAHVVRCFEDGDVVHVSGSVDPVRDIETIETELVLADMETVSKAIERAQKTARSGNKEAKARVALLERLQAHMDDGSPARSAELSDDDRIALRDLHLITAKPMLYIANVDEAGLTGNEYTAKVQAYAESVGAQVVIVCAAIESEIALLDAEDRAEFLGDLGLEEPGLDRVIRAAYRLLGLMTYFTAGEKEVRAWTVREHATAPQAAGVIHTDFEKGFIRAEVVGYDDYVAYQGESGAKDAGRWRLEGKEYIVKEGDVMHFRFNV